MIAYIKLLMYSCFFCIALGFILLGVGAFFIFLTKGYLFFPLYHVKRMLVFSCIAGTAITLATIVFNLIDKFNTRKKPPSDSV
ncbi:hypothetical protein [Tenebrionicola larvae]|jgi:hypothetical protein|uniref:Uncharacterized protein n=2 Tax=Tenebrionibacter/Tenebrionicola group TaxID=2969848 RepID=A0A8K0XZ01_9ENTR|nr:hypothetical protein [Tenebrionicola larvae]MBK4717213.1 hypothetical protein [Tenebrionibacter intestinalis]MBV5095480.1 hypothetical protein [Tenebrionicola larvae]